MRQTLKKHIKSQGRTLKWVAEKIEMSPELLSMKLNKSMKARLDKITIHRVCKVIGVEPDQVLRMKRDLSKDEVQAIVNDYLKLQDNRIQLIADKHLVVYSAVNSIINNYLKECQDQAKTQ